MTWLRLSNLNTFVLYRVIILNHHMNFLDRLVGGLVVYGFVFYLSDLAGNPYLNVMWMYCGDAVGAVIVLITIQK